jgi:hypothetical protein
MAMLWFLVVLLGGLLLWFQVDDVDLDVHGCLR